MRSTWVVITLLVVTTLVVIAPPFLTPRSTGSDTTLLFTVWGVPMEDGLFKDVYADGYTAITPGVRVEYQRYGSDLLQKYNAWFALDRGPDVMRLRVTDYHGMVARGMLEPLDEFIADPIAGMSEADLADVPPHLMEILRIDGALYALPEDNAQYGLFYSKAIFDAYNAAHPDDPLGYPNAAWTWEDLREAARRLTVRRPSGEIEVAGIDFAIWSWPFMSFYAQAGGDLWDEAGTTCLIDSDAGVRTLTFLRALQREDGSYRVSIGRNSPTGPDALFLAGKSAMYLDGSWRVPMLERVDPAFEFAVSPLPRGPRDGGRPAVVSGSVLWGISSRASHKDEAWRMLLWLTQEEQAQAYWDVLRVAPPASLRVVNAPAFRSTSGLRNADGSWEIPPMSEAAFADKAAWLRYAIEPHALTGEPPGFVPVGPYQTELETLVTEMLEDWLSRSNSDEPGAVLERVVSRVHAIIDRDRAAKGLAKVERVR
jgi:multiple sugar transport system substrate-binding protein